MYTNHVEKIITSQKYIYLFDYYSILVEHEIKFIKKKNQPSYPSSHENAQDYFVLFVVFKQISAPYK
jgi:hypothetical protein